MGIMDVIKQRRTIKKFKPDEIAGQKWKSWLEAASYAPNHRMTEPWEIMVLGPETRKKLAHKTDMGGAPLVLAILSKKGKTVLETEENKAATACFIQNFMLAAWEDGAGTFWSSVGASPKNLELLGVGEDRDMMGIFGVGYPEELPSAKDRTSIETKITEIP